MANPNENGALSAMEAEIELEGQIKQLTSDSIRKKRGISPGLNQRIAQINITRDVEAQKEATKSARKALESSMLSLEELTEKQLTLEDELYKLMAETKAWNESQGSLDLAARRIIVFFLKLFGQNVLYPGQETKEELTKSSGVLLGTKKMLREQEEALSKYSGVAETVEISSEAEQLDTHTRIKFTMGNGTKIDSPILTSSFQQQVNVKDEGAEKIIEERKRILENLQTAYGIKEEEREEFCRKFQEALERLKKQEKPEVPRVENYEDPKIEELKGRIKLLGSMSESQLQQQGIENPKSALTEVKKQLKKKEKQLATAKKARANNINQLGFKELRQNGDGHCLFRSVAHALTGEKPPQTNTGDDLQTKLRKVVAAFMLENKNDYIGFYSYGEGVSQEEQFKKKLQKFSDPKNGVYGGDQEINVLEKILNVNIQVYRINRAMEVNLDYSRTFDEETLAARGSRPTISILYDERIKHYTLLVANDKQINTRHTFAPDVQVDSDGIDEHIRKGEAAGLFEAPKRKVKKRSK